MAVFSQFGYSPKNFIALVQHSGLSQAEFMNANKITKSAYYRYRTGETSVNWNKWKSLVGKYNLDIENKQSESREKA